MPVSNARFETLFVIRFAETAGMSELKTNHRLTLCSMRLAVCLEQNFPKLRQSRLVLLRNNQLIWIGPAVCAHSHGFSAVNQRSAAFPKPLPTTANVVRDSAGGCSIPS